MKVDVLVLGAGMVGISSAIHLQDRGRSVALVDRRGPAQETSYGNAGLIQSEAVMPYVFPRDPSVVLQALFGLRTDARVRWSALPKIAPFVFAYARAGSVTSARRTALANVPLLARVRAEHEALMDRAEARHHMIDGGYIRVYREARDLEAASKVDEAVRDEFGVEFELWDTKRLAEEEPNLTRPLAGAVHHASPGRVDDPGEVGAAYARLFESGGGTLRNGDARTLNATDGGWRVTTEAGVVEAREVVVALGAWSADVLAPLGVRPPLGVKRGYHLHYRPSGNARLNHLMFDSDNGYVLAPMKRGLRLTSGVEFAHRDDASNFAQINAAETQARTIFPLEERVEETPWRGARPCLPDMLPAIGPVPGKPGLFVNFGHHHLGFTMGPTTGRLLAETMTGETPFTDPAPYRIDRF
ncbi:FAD-binding oxidoreductase [Acuticoccus sp. I52.16.1]|uniref:NAD(P)/FAD-dependent oxidoreductase n=1 Tax=Acuticoccus sp. I52.16.1 TaxID=2928472 RepID=UPI001FD24499|nr:FAD-binding oxidoreductase [Acuticoccus sp. I52.16.1]UOM34827.1 FAD-binding oxidoreductase [Acuticoccus sp. I52.16.1]